MQNQYNLHFLPLADRTELLGQAVRIDNAHFAGYLFEEIALEFNEGDLKYLAAATLAHEYYMDHAHSIGLVYEYTRMGKAILSRKIKGKLLPIIFNCKFDESDKPNAEDEYYLIYAEPRDQFRARIVESEENTIVWTGDDYHHFRHK